ncbi:unnamed protein product, partial [Rotaria sp. Silwood1]
MKSEIDSASTHAFRKWFGVIWLLIEANISTANIFGFAALFEVLPEYGIFGEYCHSVEDVNSTKLDCSQQTQKYQILIHHNRITLPILSYIWLSFGALLLISSFLFLDWKFPILNLPYKLNIEPDHHPATPTTNHPTETKWYTKIHHRVGIWKHLISPLYILVVLFLSFLILPTNILSVTWYPWVYFVTDNNKDQ